MGVPAPRVWSGGLIVGELDAESSGPDWAHFGVFMTKTLDSHSASLHSPRVRM